MQEGVLDRVPLPFCPPHSLPVSPRTFSVKAYKAANQKVQGKKRFAAGCKYLISVIQTFVSSVTHRQGLGKNYWDVTQYVGWSSGEATAKAVWSRERQPAPQLRQGGKRMDLQKGQNMKLLQKLQGTSWMERSPVLYVHNMFCI